MASRCLEEERSGRQTRSSNLRGPTTRAAAARATSKLAVAVLAAPGPPQQTILGHLEQDDKMKLGSACASLRQASLAWFPEVTAFVCTTDVASLAAWLERHQVRLHLRIYPVDAQEQAEWNDSLTALPPSLVTSLAARLPGLPAALSRLMALTRLELTGIADQRDNVFCSISAHLLRPLRRLRQLSLENCDLGSKGQKLLSLPAGLQALVLTQCKLEQLPQAVSVLTQLTALDLSGTHTSALAPLASLQRLQSLNLNSCSLTAVPQQLSALTALTRLDLFNNENLATGWQHLLPLTQLQDLELWACGLTAMPAQLSALTALTRMYLSFNLLASGWQHLLPLAQLQHLFLARCNLTAVPQQLSELTALTRLDLADNVLLGGDWQHLLPLTQLQDLKLRFCSLTALPAQLSALTALTRLDLAGNEQLAGGWQHLQPLTRLQHLNLSWCGLAAVPQQLSALTSLIRLDLGHNSTLACGWQHLLLLTQLRQLNLGGVPLPEGVAPLELRVALPQLLRDQLAMASRCLEEELSGQESHSSGIDSTPTKAAAAGAGELALALLATPGPPQLIILGHLEQNDKVKLGSACTSLRQASLAWFSEVTVKVKVGRIDLAWLAAWLERHQARLHLLLEPDDEEDDYQLSKKWNDSLTALPSSLVTSLAVHSPIELPAPVSTLTALTRLELKFTECLLYNSDEDSDDYCKMEFMSTHLRPLMQLRQLGFEDSSMSDNGEELLSLPALAGLQALRLARCYLEQLPRALSAHTQLTALDLSGTHVSALAPLAALQRLQSLDLRKCSLAAVPQQLSGLTALTRLDLSYNWQLAGGWQHLLPLTRLRNLNLCGTPFAFRGAQIVRSSRTTAARPAARLIVRAGPVKNDPPRNDGSSADDRLAKDPAINPGGWTRTQEVSNGRAAIAGLIAAFIAEKSVHTSAFDQLFGSAGGAPWAKPLFFVVVGTFIAITGAELKATGNQPISGNPQASPFSPEVRLNAGRAAMVGFAALMEERSGPLRPSGSTAAGPTTRAAAARVTGELALAVLAPPGPPQQTILGHLEQDDKMRLGSACTSLRQASLAWFPEVTVEVQPGETDLVSLAAWLERHQARLHLQTDPADALQHESSEQERNSSLMALPSSLVTSLTTHNPLPAAVSALTALTSLVSEAVIDEQMEEEDILFSSISAHQLRPLMQLRQLSLGNCDISGNAEELLSLPALAGLQALDLDSCQLQAAPRALSALTQLTALDLSSNDVSATAALANLHRLRVLVLFNCCLAVVPKQLAALTALTRLDLSSNSRLAGGWQHLLPLTQLRQLNLCECGLRAVPQELLALTALTQLDVSINLDISSGWQHLLPLTQLQNLDLSSCGLNALPRPLSALTALTRLVLSSIKHWPGGWQHLQPLTQLQDLTLNGCGFAAVPQQLSALTALTSLGLGFNRTLTSGWQHLLALTKLQDLILFSCGLTAVPQQLSALTALTCLDLSANSRLSSGWQYLQPLTSLQLLDLRGVGLSSCSAPPELAALPRLQGSNPLHWASTWCTFTASGHVVSST
ncbi:Receptor-like protein 50 [Chlorella vulgaris]